MTKKEIAKFVGKLTCYPASVIDVDFLCYDAMCKPSEIEEISSFEGNLIVYTKFGVRVNLKSMYRYVMVDSSDRRYRL